MADHRSLGRPGRTGGVGQNQEILGFGRMDLLSPALRMLGLVGSAELLQCFQAHALSIVQMPEPFHVEDDDLFQGGGLGADLKHFIQLLLVFGEVETGVAVFDQILHLIRRVRGIDPIDHTADARHAHVGE